MNIGWDSFDMSNHGKKYLKFGAVTFVILVSMGYLAYTGVQESKSYYVTIKELQTMGDGAYSKRLRVAARIGGPSRRHPLGGVRVWRTGRRH